MQIKPGTVGYVKRGAGWSKCVAERPVGTTLVVRIAPHLDGLPVHIEQFLPEREFRELGYPGAEAVSIRERLRQFIAVRSDYIRQKLRNKAQKKHLDSERIILTGSVGWAKTYSRRKLFFRKSWKRCFVLKQQNHHLTLCCAPDLTIAFVHPDNFVVDDSDRQIRIKKHPLNFSSK
ncbi:MAG: hypothetical protein ACE5G1_02095 [bacterium]